MPYGAVRLDCVLCGGGTGTGTGVDDGNHAPKGTVKREGTGRPRAAIQWLRRQHKKGPAHRCTTTTMRGRRHAMTGRGWLAGWRALGRKTGGRGAALLEGMSAQRAVTY